MINIITDSTSDLGADIAAEFNLLVVPLAVTIGGKAYRDGMDISQKDLFALAQKHGELPKTAAPSVGEFIKIFDLPGDSVFVGISSKLSATIQNAILAAETFPAGKVRIIDSLNLSSGVGLLALRAAGLRDRGASADQVEKELEASVAKLHTSFVIDTMEYIYKGGRCTAIQAIAGSVLKIHPIIEVNRDGTLGVKEKARGPRLKGIQKMLDDFMAHLDVLDPERVFVTHTFSDQDAVFLKSEIMRLAAPKDVRITRAGSVISSHCGSGTIGILYFEK
jgi:DegV family protein with EDD domain